MTTNTAVASDFCYCTHHRAGHSFSPGLVSCCAKGCECRGFNPIDKTSNYICRVCARSLRNNRLVALQHSMLHDSAEELK